MYVCEALKLARRKWSWYSIFDGSAATASVNSWAAFSHCCALRSCIPRLKFFSPFFAERRDRQGQQAEARSKEIRVRVRVLFLMTSLG